MRKHCKRILFLFIGMSILNLVHPPAIEAETPVKVGVYQNKPLLFQDENGEINGIFADVLAYVAQEEGWKIEYVMDSWAQCLQNLKSEKIDALGPIAYSQERKINYDFTYESILTNWGQIYVNKESGIESILDLTDRKIAVLKNDVYYLKLRDLIKQFGIECRFVEAFEYDDVLQLVEIGKCDAGLVGYLYGHQFERDYDIYRSSIVLSPQKIHFAVPKGKNTAIIDAIDFHLRKLKRNKDSVYYASISKWVGVESKAINTTWLLGISGGALLLVLIFFCLNLVLRSQVRKRTKELDIKNKNLVSEIEHRKKIEAALQENEKEYRSVFENTGTATIIIEEDMIISKANAKAEKLAGYSKAEIENKLKTTDFVAGEELERITRYHHERRKFKGHISSEYTFKLEDKHGNLKDVFIQTSMIPGTKRSIASIIDITSRVKAEEDLRRSEEKYRTTLENIEEGYFEIDTNGTLIFFNNALCKITGYSGRELMGINLKQLSGQATADRMFQVFDQIFRTGKPKAVVDFDINLKDGRTITIDLSANPIKRHDGEISGFRGFMRDVTERKKAEEERQNLERKLQQAQKMKAVGTLAGGVAHDLNNILSGIVGYPELILLDLPKESPLREPIRTIQESGKKAAAIVEDLLTLARRGVTTSETMNLNDVISDYLICPVFEKLQSFHPLVEIETRLDDALLNILGSPVHLSKTVMNLVSNAAEAMPEGGNIRIQTENKYIDQPIHGYDDVREGDYVVLTVSDTGIGIAPEEIGRIFEPFYTKKVMGRSGTGLGMAVVWGTVKDHKGYINVNSELKEGTTFKLYFPVTRKGATGDQHLKDLADFKGNGQSILVVDDRKEQREIASKMLSELGYFVETVSSGEEAIDYLRKDNADLIVLDMIMPPGIDGLETYKRVLEIHPDQKAIIASGFSETSRVKKAQRLGAGKYVKKPYTLEKIGLAVKSELGNKKKAA
ncbi:MAG: PAS domain S-box protein [Desulfobacterales bacterium]|jgi:PAS domain S-box-containing protein